MPQIPPSILLKKIFSFNVYCKYLFLSIKYGHSKYKKWRRGSKSILHAIGFKGFK